MNKSDVDLMQYSINIASKNNDFFVGVVLALSNGKVICSNEKQNKNDWACYILEIINILNIKMVDKLYLTINTYENGEFSLNKILKKISIQKIFVGLPDPRLNSYLKNDPILQFSDLEFYPDNLQKLIISQNKSFFSKSSQNIKNNLYYSEKRISEFVKNKLCERGLNLTKEEIDNNKTIDKLVDYLVDKYHASQDDIQHIVSHILSEAFNKKYASYDYKNDVRSINNAWNQSFYFICRELSIDLSNNIIINVGVGSGNEATQIFKNCQNITFVDIAPDGLKKIKKMMPQSKIIVSSAENLDLINDNSYDAYISLRTFNSSFFNHNKAMNEAKRILKNNGYIIISIANGFLCSNHNIIPGLIIPGTEFIDLYKGLDIIKKLAKIMYKIGFKNIKMLTTNEEIYLFANLENGEKNNV